MAIIGGMGGFPELTGTATENKILAPYTAYTTNPLTPVVGTIPSIQAQSYIPSRVPQIIASNVYLAGDQRIEGIPYTYAEADWGEINAQSPTKLLTIQMHFDYTPDIVSIFGGSASHGRIYWAVISRSDTASTYMLRGLYGDSSGYLRFMSNESGIMSYQINSGSFSINATGSGIYLEDTYYWNAFKNEEYRE